MTEEDFTKLLSLALEDVTCAASPDWFGLDSKLSDLRLDSLTRIELITVIEERLNVDIDDSVLRAATTARDLYNAVV